jgi:monofunctional biosynthetic peptidoglycan transglycosylase
MKSRSRHLLRIVWLCTLVALSLQAYFFLRVALMGVIDPSSTAFQRSEAWRLLSQTHELRWRQDWVPYDRIAAPLKRAVLASEDAAFVDHSGVEWDAIEKAWERNQAAEARAQRARPGAAGKKVEPKVVGGSTITQQLAKNLFLSGERTVVRKGQELVLTWMLEALLSKQRILECYLNGVEWGEGVFGAQAAAQHYFRVDASQLTASAAARLAVMLPAPKRFEKRPQSEYLQQRTQSIVARMGSVELP